MKSVLLRQLRRLAIAISIISTLWIASAGAQTASTGAIQGTITDSSHSVIPGATITLVNPATNAVLKTQSGGNGGYTFPRVTPGDYSLTVTATGFKAYKVISLLVTVNKVVPINVEMQVGAAETSVEVTASALQLQTANATVGNTISGQSMVLLPTLSRSASELINFQPATVASGPQTRVAGAVDDQNTFTLDGIDITSMDPSNVDNATDVPVPVNAVDEFRVGVTNNPTSMDTASGGQVSLIGKSGTNQIHGSAFDDLENSALNANTWQDNHTPKQIGSTKYATTPRAPLRENLFGGTIGGPIVKNKTFLFISYEGERNTESVDTASLVPTPTLEQGTLQFASTNGTLISYPLATSMACGANGDSACDARGLGLTPTMAAMFKLYPAANDFTEGDGINYAGYDVEVSTPETLDYITTRLDQNLGKWHFNADYAYMRDIKLSNGLGGLGAQLDIINGADVETRQTPIRNDMILAGLVGQLTANMTNAFHVGTVRLRTRRAPLVPSQWAAMEALPGTAVSSGYTALLQSPLLSGLIGDEPFQQEGDRSTQYVDTLDWVHGAHSFEFGGNVNHISATETRNNQLGASSSLQVTDYASDYLVIPGADQPVPCSASTTANCLPNSDLSHWNSLYSSLLGMVDNVGVMDVRNADLTAQPLGTNIHDNNTYNTIYFYGQDIWKLTRSLTASYGLSWGRQTVPREVQGEQMVMLNSGTGQPVSALGYMNAKLTAAESGQFYNPTFSFVPERDSPSGSLFTSNPGYWAPRVGLAWNPGFSGGVLGALFGNQKAVVRGGFGLVDDRENSVKTTTVPALGLGFADTPTLATPSCGISGTPGSGCNTSSSNPALSDFRVGVDGQIPLPTVVPTETAPIVPAQDLGALATFQLDPDNVTGYAYTGNLNIQRQLSGSMVMSFGWIGHYGRDLPQPVDLTEAPYMFLDTTSGQTFAQAYEAIEGALTAGQAAPDEAWFDDMVPAQSGVKGSAYLTANDASLFENGQVRLIFNAIDGLRKAAGLPTFDNYQLSAVGMGTHVGRSNYNAFVATLQGRGVHGLTFALNYTWSHELDDQILDQNNSGYYANGYFINEDYGDGIVDVRQSLNSTFVYQLPFHTANWTNRLVRNWYASGLVTAQTSFPITVSAVGQAYGSNPEFGGSNPAIPTVSPGTMHAGVHSVNGGTNLFANPAQVFSEFRNINLVTDRLNGAASPIRGLPLRNLDLSVGKKIQIRERYSFSVSAQAFNFLNNVNFNPPSLSLGSPSNFGDITSQLVPANRQQGSRWIQLQGQLTF